MAPKVSYASITIEHIYFAVQPPKPSTPEAIAFAWVEAENIIAIRAIVCRWFELLQAGQADGRYPDPQWQQPKGKKPLTPELADRLVAELDADFELEKHRFPESDVNNGPCFHRLKPWARMAFAQEFYNAIKTEAQIEEEAVSRLKAGEKFPPPEVQRSDP